MLKGYEAFSSACSYQGQAEVRLGACCWALICFRMAANLTCMSTMAYGGSGKTSLAARCAIVSLSDAVI